MNHAHVRVRCYAYSLLLCIPSACTGLAPALTTEKPGGKQPCIKSANSQAQQSTKSIATAAVTKGSPAQPPPAQRLCNDGPPVDEGGGTCTLTILYSCDLHGAQSDFLQLYHRDGALSKALPARSPIVHTTNEPHVTCAHVWRPHTDLYRCP
jgi:hypothetical protein